MKIEWRQSPDGQHSDLYYGYVGEERVCQVHMWSVDRYQATVYNELGQAKLIYQSYDSLKQAQEEVEAQVEVLWGDMFERLSRMGFTLIPKQEPNRAIADQVLVSGEG